MVPAPTLVILSPPTFKPLAVLVRTVLLAVSPMVTLFVDTLVAPITVLPVPSVTVRPSLFNVVLSVPVPAVMLSIAISLASLTTSPPFAVSVTTPMLLSLSLLVSVTPPFTESVWPSLRSTRVPVSPVKLRALLACTFTSLIAPPIVLAVVPPIFV